MKLIDSSPYSVNHRTTHESRIVGVTRNDDGTWVYPKPRRRVHHYKSAGAKLALERDEIHPDQALIDVPVFRGTDARMIREIRGQARRKQREYLQTLADKKNEMEAEDAEQSD